MKPGQGLGECPALAAAAQKYGAQCLDLTFFQGGPPIAAYACGKNAKVTAATQSVCNKLPNQQYHQTVVSGSGSSSGSGSGPDPGSGSSFGSDVWDSATSAGRFGAWGDDNEGWQTTTSTGAALGSVAQVGVGLLGLKVLHNVGSAAVRGVSKKLPKTEQQLGDPEGNLWGGLGHTEGHTEVQTVAQLQAQQQNKPLGGGAKALNESVPAGNRLDQRDAHEKQRQQQQQQQQQQQLQEEGKK